MSKYIGMKIVYGRLFKDTGPNGEWVEIDTRKWEQYDTCRYSPGSS